MSVSQDNLKSSLRQAAVLAAFIGISTVAGANLPPVVNDITVKPNPKIGSPPATVKCLATDPEGSPLTYYWSVKDGILSGGNLHTNTVTWELPQEMGNYMMNFAIVDELGGYTSGERMVPMGPVAYYATLDAPLRQPGRMTLAPDKTLWITDNSPPRAVHLGNGGVFLGEFPVGPLPTGIAVDTSGNILVCEDGMNRVMRYTPDGTPLGALGGGSVSLKKPNGIEVDQASGNIYVVDSESRNVRVFNAAGTPVQTIGGPSRLDYPVDIALNMIAGEIYIADQTDNAIEVYNPGGTAIRRFGTEGFGPGQFTRLQALEIDENGIIVALDAVHCRIQLLQPDGTPIAIAGHMGSWSGAMQTPLGMAVLPGQRLFISSASTGDIRVFAHWEWLDANVTSGEVFIIK